MNDDNIPDVSDTYRDIVDDKSTDAADTTRPAPFDKPVPNEPVGHISAQGEGLQVGRHESIVRAFLHPNERDRVSVGDYVRVPYYQPDDSDKSVDKMLLASVSDIRYVPRSNIEDQNLVAADSFGEDNYRCVSVLEPIAVVKCEDGEFDSEFVSKPPLPTVRIGKVNDRAFLREGLDIPSDGIYVGDMAVNNERVPSKQNPLEYYLKNPNATDGTSGQGEPTIFRHILVAGSTGTGKTHISKNILRQIAKCKRYEIDVPPEEETDRDGTRERRMNLTIIDPEEEYTEMGADPDNLATVKSQIAGPRQGVEFGGLNAAKNDTAFKTFVPAINGASPNVSAPGGVEEFGIPFSLVRDHNQLLMPADPKGPTRQAITEILAEYFRQQESMDDEPTYERFRRWLQQNEERFGNEYNDSMFQAAKRRLIQSTYGEVFDAGADDILEMTDRIFASNQVSVITTGHLKGETENFVIQALLSHIVDNKIASNVEHPQIKGTPLVMALDEAHEYLAQPETTREHYIVNKFRRAARRGRKDKFGLYFISQNPEDIDGEVRNQLNTKVYLRLEPRVANSQDVFIPPEFIKQIPNFNKGQMVVRQPDVQDVEVKGLRETLTRHSN